MWTSSRPTSSRGAWSMRRGKSKPASMSGGPQEASTSQRRPKARCCWACSCGRIASSRASSELVEGADRHHVGFVELVDLDALVLGTHADAEKREPGSDAIDRRMPV